MQVMFSLPSVPDPSRVLCRPSQSRDHIRFRQGRVRRLPLRRIRNWPNGALPARPDGHPDHERVLQLTMGSTVLVYAVVFVRAGGARSASNAWHSAHSPPSLGSPTTHSPMRQLLAIMESTSPESKRGPPIPHVFEAAAE